MLKIDERNIATSCWNRADLNERIFVLLGRDPAASAAIHAWVDERIRLGKNTPSDLQIVEAIECARQMDLERDHLRRTLGKED